MFQHALTRGHGQSALSVSTLYFVFGLISYMDTDSSVILNLFRSFGTLASATRRVQKLGALASRIMDLNTAIVKHHSVDLRAQYCVDAPKVAVNSFLGK